MKHPLTLVCVALACALSIQAGTVRAAAPPSPAGFECGDKFVRVERFVPKQKGKRPAVILLHGLDGMEANGSLYRDMAKRLAARGYLAVLVHYFDRTGTTKKDLPALIERFRACLDGSKGAAKRWQEEDAVFTPWLEAVRGAVADTRRHPRVDADRVALAGFSLGGFLATSAASVKDSGVRCVIDLFGGLPRPLADQARHMPPALLLHGDADEVVPVREAHALRDLLKEHRRECEAKVYRTGHCFIGRDGRLDWLAAWDAERRAFAFLDRHLVRNR